MHEHDDDDRMYRVLVNDEEQYSLWPASRENPPGWRNAGKEGRKVDCLAFVKDVWTDMQPLSLRKIMNERSQA